jgi:hypothetical protein
MKNTTQALNTNAPSHEAVSQHAREIWLTRGCPEGRDNEIWLEAELQLVEVALVPAPAADLNLPGSGNTQESVIAAKAVQQKHQARAPQMPAVHNAPRAKTAETGKPLWSKPHSS